jgi:HJR/Mrr/RecB family endonuclease
VTNSTFTKSAQSLAYAVGIRLIDGNELKVLEKKAGV